MIKKTLLTTLIVLGCLLPWSESLAHDFTAVNEGKTIYYTITDGVNHYVAVAPNGTSTNSYEGDIVIPSTVTYNDIEYTVTSVAANAFKRSYEGATGGRVTSVALPNTITSIGDNAFAYGSTYLTSVNIPENVESIGKNAFDACKGITSVTLPSGITSLGQQAFNACTGLTEINYNITNLSTGFSSKKGPFYGCSGSIILTIGNNVTSIPSYAFEGANIIGTITIPDNVTTINTNAFYNITSYDKLIIGSGVTTLGGQAFSGCTGLTEIWAKPTTVPTCGYSLFYQVSRSIPVYVPEGTYSSYHANMQWSDFTLTEYLELTTAVVVGENETLNMGSVYLTIGVGGSLTIEDGGQLICNNSVNATLQKEITAAEVWGIPGADAWYFIASPVDGYATSNVIITGTSDTDLFSFDEGSSYWYNAQGSAHLFTTLTRGQGYLYANSTGDDLAFSGEMPATNSNIEKDLSFAGSGNAKGYNLMGNPFTCNLTTDNVKFYNGTTNTDITSYYTVENGTDLSLVTFSGNPIKPGRGFMIQATGEGQKLVFNPVAKSEKAAAKPSFITIEAGNDQFIDRACIQIGSGNTLRKMTINDHVSHVYVVYDGKDYAAATITEMQGEIPVYFVAAKNGQYTIKVKTDNLETSYLHLIDNLTGANIDLLQTPSYTFQGHITDISARFRLLFTTTGVDENADEGQTDFAFISDGQLIVNGTGILYVYDALGRQVSAKQVTPLTSTLSPLTSGVYVLQLVEGNSVRTQKIIVK